jgi:F-type H+-transporting ATPase subunit a
MLALRKTGSIFIITFSLFILSLFYTGKGFATIQDNSTLTLFADTSAKKEMQDESVKEKFNAGEMIMEHVVDNHEWHVMAIGHIEVTIPLPIILFSGGRFYCFSSSRFHNETHSYQGFRLEPEGPDKGKIVSLKSENRKEDRPRVYDLSITKTVLAIFISSFLLILIFVSVARAYRRNPKEAPHGLQSLLEPMILFIRDDIAKSSIGEKKYEKFLPYLLTIFFFIFFNNLFGLIPFFLAVPM